MKPEIQSADARNDRNSCDAQNWCCLKKCDHVMDKSGAGIGWRATKLLQLQKFLT